MATGKKPNNNKTAIFQLIINSGGATGTATVIVCGRVATFGAIIHPTITGTNLTLAGFPSGYDQYKPLNSQWLSCDGYASSGGNRAEAYMSSDGNLIVSTPSKEDWKISGTWITAG